MRLLRLYKILGCFIIWNGETGHGSRQIHRTDRTIKSQRWARGPHVTQSHPRKVLSSCFVYTIYMHLSIMIFFSETSIMIIISGLMRPSDFVDSRSELEVQIQPKSVNIIHLLLPSAILNLWEKEKKTVRQWEPRPP